MEHTPIAAAPSKVRAVSNLIRELAVQEVKKLQNQSKSWVSKVLVFNKLIKGTAVQLRQQIETSIDPIFDDTLETALREGQLVERETLQARTRVIVDKGIRSLSEKVRASCELAAGVLRQGAT